MTSASTDVPAPIEPYDPQLAAISTEPGQIAYDASFDWFFQRLVRQVNDGNTYPVTLTIGGGLLSGWMIGGAEYFRRFAEDFASFSAQEDVSASLRAWALSFVDFYSDIDEDSADPIYVHLADAKWIGNGQSVVPIGGGMLWRGKVAAVEGFTLGRLTVGTEK